MARLSDRRCEDVLRAYFEEGLEAEDIEARMRLNLRTVVSVLCDKRRLEPYHARSEAARLRAQICVNENAEEAARRQARLLRGEETAQTVTQRAAKDILDRAGVRVEKADKQDITIRFAGNPPNIGMPRRREADEWTST